MVNVVCFCVKRYINLCELFDANVILEEKE